LQCSPVAGGGNGIFYNPINGLCKTEEGRGG
jgi:hypothetical protein